MVKKNSACFYCSKTGRGRGLKNTCITFDSSTPTSPNIYIINDK